MTIKHLMAVNESDLYGRNGSYRSILCRICSLARGEGKDFPGWCTASEKYLAMTTGFSVRTVQRAIAQFRKDGVLFVRTYRRNGRKYNHYKPNMPLLEASRRKRESAVLIEEGGAHETESDGELAIRQNVESRGDAMSSSIRQSGALVSRAREVEEEKVDAVRQTCRAELRSTGKGLSKADSPKALSGKDPGGVAPGPPPSPIQREGELPRLPSGVPESLRSQLTSAADAARSRGEKLAALVAREPVPPPPSREDRDPPPASAAPLPKTKFQAARALIEETKRTDFDTYLRGYSLAFQFAGYLEERAERGEKAFAFTRWEIMYTADFIEYLYSRTIYDQLPLRRVPANITIKGQDGAATGYWVGESKAIPATTADFMDVNLLPLKVAALAVISNELIKDSSPDAEMMVRDALVQASSQRIDLTFLSAAAAVAGVAPAGILNGVTGVTASGTDSDAMRVDNKALYAPFIAAKNATDLMLVLNPSLAKSISLMVNALGQTEFTGLKATGGDLFGDPAVTGENVTAGQLILLKPSDIYRIGDTGVEVSVSRETMIEQSTVPTGATDTPVAASQAFTSMFQSESTAIKVVRRINFAKRRASAVSLITGAAYA